MASPQKEDGYTPIANELMEALAKYRIPGEERQVFDVILRKTYGFSKKLDAISYSQFTESTGLSKSNVARSLAKLRDKNLIMVLNIEYGTQKRVPKEPTKAYGIVKDYKKWLRYSKVSTVLKSDNKGVLKSEKHKNNIQKQIPPTPLLEIPAWLDRDVWESYRIHRKTIKSKMTDQAERLAVQKLGKLRSQGFDPNEVINQSIENGWKGLFEVKSLGGSRNQTHQTVSRPIPPDPEAEARLNAIYGGSVQ